jgi:internalin A
MNIGNKKKLYIIGSAVAAVVVIVLILVLALGSCSGNRYDEYYAQGEEAFLSGDYSTALKKLEKAISEKAQPEAYLLMAEAYAAQGKTDMAIQVLYLGYSKTGDEAIARRLEELKSEKNGDATSGSDDSITIGGTAIATDTSSLVLAEMHLNNDDIANIGALKQLSNLSLSDNNLTDISPLSELTQLTFLQISNNKISDLSPLRGLTKLKTLYVDGNPATDFTPLYALTNLRTLSMKNVTITQSQLEELQEALPNCSIYCDDTVEEVIDIELGHSKFKSDVVELSLSGQALTDISALAQCKHLVSLDLSGNRVEDISCLMDLQELMGLNLNNNRVTDLSPLMSLSDLTVLSVESNGISNIAVLSYLTKLEELHLDGNDIKSFSPLSNLTSLQLLSLRDTGITDDDLDVLISLKELKTLDLRDNVDLSANKVDELQKALPDCSIVTSDLLYTVTFGNETFRSDVETLTAVSANVNSLAGLENFKSLKSLVLSNNAVTSLEELKDLSALEVLDLYSNGVSDLSPLKNHTRLRSIDLIRNNISDISALGSCTGLEDLELSFNSISDISALAGCTSLRELALDNNSITNVAALSYLRNLTTLNLDNNNISDLTPLYLLSKLQTLYIRGNSSLTVVELQALQEALPNCTIVCDEALNVENVIA